MSRRDTIYGIIAPLVAPEPVIWADQNAPRPSGAYWTLRLNARRSLGTDEYSQGVNDDGELTIDGVREETLTVQRIGPSAQDYVCDFRDDMSRVTVLDQWRAADMVVYDLGAVGFIPFRMDNDHIEPRAAVDLFIRYGVRTLDEVGTIQDVQIGTEVATDSTLPNYDPDLAGTIDVDLS
jgi:hypothetical protein